MHVAHSCVREACHYYISHTAKTITKLRESTLLVQPATVLCELAHFHLGASPHTANECIHITTMLHNWTKVSIASISGISYS